jgi:uncharacterized protein (TIGR03118 family)
MYIAALSTQPSPRRSVHRAARTFAALLSVAALSMTAGAQTGGVYKVTNLVSDGSVAAAVTDPNFVNPWAISDSGTWWVSAAGSGFNYVISSATGAISFKVIVPAGAAPNTANGFPAGSVTTSGTVGMILPAPNLTKASFLFSTLDGTISGWNSKLGTANALSVIAVNNSTSGASYPGLAIINTGTASYILAPNFGTGNKIEVYDSTFKPTTLTGSFTDPALPAGYAPFSVHVINNQVWVAYALRTSAPPFRTVDAVGNGVVDLFDLSGTFITRVATGGNLDSPWGVAIAPANFGIFSNDILIGNFGNGRINAYDPKTYSYMGQLTDGAGAPLSYASLWELLPGGTLPSNGTSGSGGSTSNVYFTAGLAGETHGLFGFIANDSTSTGTPSYGVSSSAPALTVADGGSATANISIAPTYSFKGTVTFACSGLPTAASCTFSPSQVSAVATAPSFTSVTIHTAKFTAMLDPRVNHTSGIACAILLPINCMLAFSRRRRLAANNPLRLFVFCGIMFASLGAIMGCADVPLPASTPTGTSQVVVTATSGSISQSTSIALTVQ